MNMLDWVEKEVELACKKECPDWDGNSFDYGCSCYQSALKAYKSLLEDGHSGFSWGITKNILIRLMNNQPLTPITEEDFYNEGLIGADEEYLNSHNLKSEKQCLRMSSLFRHEYVDGAIKYSDVDRYYCFNINNPEDTYSGGGASKIIDDIFPITLPYMPQVNKYKIACEDFLVNPDMGDFDTKAYHYIITPDGERVEVNKFYKEIKVGDLVTQSIEFEKLVPSNDNTDSFIPVVESEEYTYQPTEWVEITKEEFEERKANKIDIVDKKEAE